MPEPLDDYLEWREIAEWDWAVIPGQDHLHAVETMHDPALVAEEWGGAGVTVCGQDALLVIPGLFTRMQAPRCRVCCDSTGMPHGVRSPKNVDECRPVCERRIANLDRVKVPRNE